MQPDPLQSYLDKTQLNKSQKADIWDTYHSVNSPGDFKSGFDKLNVPNNVKADLWDLRFPHESTVPDINHPNSVRNPTPLSVDSGWASDEHFGGIIGALEKGWNALNTPIGDFGGHAGRTQDAFTHLLTGHSTDQVENQLEKLRTSPNHPAIAGADAFALGSIGSRDASVAKEGANMFATPLGLATLGAGGMLEKFAARAGTAAAALHDSLDILEAHRLSNAAPEAIQSAMSDVAAARNETATWEATHRASKFLNNALATGFGGAGAQQAVEASHNLDTAKTPQEHMAALSGLLSSLGQMGFGVHALGEGFAGDPDAAISIKRGDREIEAANKHLISQKAQQAEAAASVMPRPIPPTPAPKEMLKVPELVKPEIPVTSKLGAKTGSTVTQLHLSEDAPVNPADSVPQVSPTPSPKIDLAPPAPSPITPRAPSRYPTSDAMRARSNIRMTQAMQALRKGELSGADPSTLQGLNAEVLKHAQSWAKYADVQDVTDKINTLETKIKSGLDDAQALAHLTSGDETNSALTQQGRDALTRNKIPLSATESPDKMRPYVAKLLSDQKRDLAMVEAFKKGKRISTTLGQDIAKIGEVQQPQLSGDAPRTAPTRLIDNRPAGAKPVEASIAEDRVVAPEQVLGVSNNATPEELKSAYRKRAKELHPDLNPDKDTLEASIKLNKAYAQLTGKDVASEAFTSDMRRDFGALFRDLKDPSKPFSALNSPRPKSPKPSPIEVPLPKETPVEAAPVPREAPTPLEKAPAIPEPGSEPSPPTPPISRTPTAADTSPYKINQRIRARVAGRGEVSGRVESIGKNNIKFTPDGSNTALFIQNKDILGPVTEARTTPVSPDATGAVRARESLIASGMSEQAADSALRQGGVLDAHSRSHTTPPEPREASSVPTPRIELAEPSATKTPSPNAEPIQQEAKIRAIPQGWEKNPGVYESLRDHVEKLVGDKNEAQHVLQAGLDRYRDLEKTPGIKREFLLKSIKDEITSAFTDPKPPDDIEMGLGLFPPGLLQQAGNFVDRLVDRLNGTTEEVLTKNIIRRRGAKYAQDRMQVLNRFDAAIKSHEGDGEPELRAWMDAAEDKPGATPLSPDEKLIADSLKAEFNARWAILQKRFPDRFTGAGIDDYMKHLFEKPTGKSLSRQILFGKRPLAGSGSFMKHRFHAFLSDGLDAGLTPVTYNPIRMQTMGLLEIDRFMMAHDMKDDMKTAGLVKFVSISGKNRPPDWVKLNDNIFKPRMMAKGGLIEYGSYYAPAEAAKVFNNYLSPGLRGIDWYDKVREYGNSLNQAQLGLSAYHGAFSTINASVSDMALALQEGINTHSPEAFKTAARSLVPGLSAYHYYQLGKRIEAQYITPGTHPQLKPLVDALVRGGGRAGIDPIYENAAVEDLKRIWHSNVGKGASPNMSILQLPLKGLQAFAQMTSAPIMKYYVPRMKLGAFADLASQRVSELAKSGRINSFDMGNELGKVWDSIDNRFGQLTYDNLFVNKMAKDISFLAVRSVGWNLGTFREIGAGITGDVLRQISNIKSPSKQAELTTRLAYSAALPIVMGLIGGTYGYLTGHPAQTLDDYFFPKTSGVRPDGKPERVAFPSYMRDVYAFLRHPAETGIHKLHPVLEQSYEIYHNADFYGTEIYHEDDPRYQRYFDTSKYLLKQFEPFGFRNMQQRLQSGENRTVLGTAGAILGSELGITPAPLYIGQSNAESLAQSLAQHHYEEGPHTTEDFNKQQQFSHIKTQFRAGNISKSQLTSLLKEGKLSDHQYNSLYEETAISPFERNVKHLTAPEMLRVWSKSTPEEQSKIREMMEDKYDKIDPQTDPDTSDRFKQALFPKTGKVR